MESDFTNLLFDLLGRAEPDLNSRLESHAEAVSDLECTQPLLGRWIEAHDVQYLLAAFDLSDEDFASNFPGMAHIKENDRKRIIAAFEQHLKHCLHCYRKSCYDLEFNSRVESVCRQNKEHLIHELKSEHPEPSSEGEHEYDETLPLNEPLETLPEGEAECTKTLAVTEHRETLREDASEYVGSTALAARVTS